MYLERFPTEAALSCFDGSLVLLSSFHNIMDGDGCCLIYMNNLRADKARKRCTHPTAAAAAK
jgi:hypothetical protein